MKHKQYVITHLLTLLCVLMLCIPLYAQQGLKIAPLFNGQYRYMKGTTEVLLKGRKLAPYKLKLFRSITVGTEHVNLVQVERMVKSDATTAIDKEISSKQGHLYYAFYQWRPLGSTRRYLFYKNNALNAKGHNNTFTLIYMEGTATLDELKRNFAK